MPGAHSINIKPDCKYGKDSEEYTMERSMSKGLSIDHLPNRKSVLKAKDVTKYLIYRWQQEARKKSNGVIVVKLAEQLLPTPEVRGSNLVLCK